MRDWNNYFMGLAEQASTMATCDRLHVGCVVVKDRRVIATGFNGSVRGADHCDDVGHLMNETGHCIRTVHAEQNAIIDCARRGVCTDGSVAYCTHEPCEHCTRTLVQAGVKKVYFKHSYKNKWNKYFNDSIEWVHLTDDYVDTCMHSRMTMAGCKTYNGHDYSCELVCEDCGRQMDTAFYSK